MFYVEIAGLRGSSVILMDTRAWILFGETPRRTSYIKLAMDS